MLKREAKAPPIDEAAVRQNLCNLQAQNALPAKGANVVCPVCRGSKQVRLAQQSICQNCSGSGVSHSGLSRSSSSVCVFCTGRGKIVKMIVQSCPTCEGRGMITAAQTVQSHICPTCQGKGAIEEDETVECQCCRGSGTILDNAMKRKVGSCPFCDGTGTLHKKVRKTCPICSGLGRIQLPATGLPSIASPVAAAKVGIPATSTLSPTPLRNTRVQRKVQKMFLAHAQAAKEQANLST